MFKPTAFRITSLALIALLLSACQSAPNAVPVVQSAESSAPATVLAADTAVPASSPGIQLYYHGISAQVELISPGGTRVLIDVSSVEELSRPATENDILLSSHHHADHYVQTFAESFPGQQLNVQAGEIRTGDIVIRSILAEHAVTNFGGASACTNAIFIVDMGGIRIVHFGDFGQTSMTPELSAALENVDVVIGLLGDPRIFQKIMEERTMFTLIDQLNPSLVIPSDHSGIDSIGYAAERWQGFYSKDNSAVLSRSEWSGKPKFLVLGTLAPSYQSLYNLELW